MSIGGGDATSVVDAPSMLCKPPTFSGGVLLLVEEDSMVSPVGRFVLCAADEAAESFPNPFAPLFLASRTDVVVHRAVPKTPHGSVASGDDGTGTCMGTRPRADTANGVGTCWTFTNARQNVGAKAATRRETFRVIQKWWNVMAMVNG